ncbi:GNAT family N-acetyltransferase [Hirschia litorea]|uniref:GNAT family N-acetyltransferase n=1 Tax=Hirschia litorea TaxID=1199156 RepID=A0ABW2IJ42_9PROT
MKIVNAAEPHLAGILEIFNTAVRETFAVWTEREDTLNDRRAWMLKCQSNGFPVIVALDVQNAVLGYAAYGSFRGKEGYDITVEHSVYVANHVQGKGIGKALLTELIVRAQADSRLERMVAAIDAGNPVSEKLHAALGFEKEGYMRKVAKKWDQHRDLLIMTKDVSSPNT